MNIAPWLFGFGSALFPAPQAPQFEISDARLLNPVVSAGDLLDIRYSVSGDRSQVCQIGGAAIYLGFIVQNLFPDSEAVNRTSLPLGDGAFQVTDLKISPYAVPTQEYRVENFFVYDCNGNYDALYAQRRGGFYVHKTGEPTEIPIIKFHLNENPNGDNTPPLIQSFKLDRDSYRRGDIPRILFAATDHLSGVGRNSGAYFASGSSFGQGGIDPRTRSLGSGEYESAPYMIPKDLDPAIDSLVLMSVSVQDLAGIWGELRLPSVDSPHYVFTGGVPTDIPAVKIRITN